MIECQHCGSYRTQGEQIEDNIWDYYCTDCGDFTPVTHTPDLLRAADALDSALREIMP